VKFASRVSKERTRREQRHVWFGFVLRARFNAKEDFFAVFLSNLVLNLRKSASSSPKFIHHLAKKPYLLCSSTPRSAVLAGSTISLRAPYSYAGGLSGGLGEGPRPDPSLSFKLRLLLLLLAAPYSQAAPYHYAHHTHTPEAFRGVWGGTPQRGLGQSPREGPRPDPSLSFKVRV